MNHNKYILLVDDDGSDHVSHLFELLGRPIFQAKSAYEALLHQIEELQDYIKQVI